MLNKIRSIFGINSGNSNPETSIYINTDDSLIEEKILSINSDPIIPQEKASTLFDKEFSGDIISSIRLVDENDTNMPTFILYKEKNDNDEYEVFLAQIKKGEKGKFIIATRNDNTECIVNLSQQEPPYILGRRIHNNSVDFPDLQPTVYSSNHLQINVKDGSIKLNSDLSKRTYDISEKLKEYIDYYSDVYQFSRYPFESNNRPTTEYIEKQRHLRDYIKAKLNNKTMYSKDGFVNFQKKLIEMHKLSYYRYDGKAGVLRQIGRSTFNKRKDDSKRISREIQKYNRRIQLEEQIGTDYVSFMNDDKNPTQPRKILLEGISEDNLPIEEYNPNHINPDMIYFYTYPKPESFNQYFEKINELGLKILEAIELNSDKDEILDLIAKQYQYGAIARPFKRVNNSIFMNLLNSQLTLAGFKPIPHGDLDFLAQRLQTSDFVKYFKYYLAQSN